METAPGRLLDSRYRLGRVLGRGGMATVYAATDTKLRRPVAVKLFHPAADERTATRRRTEAQLLGALVHPGLLRVFDLCVGEAESYLVMQLVEGGTLRNLINEGPLRPVVVARLGTRLAETLHYVHSRQIVHRDIKPSNVLLDSSGTGYLADFGIATLIGSARLTATGHCVGTAAYLAPEQVAGAGARPPADIYSLGLVLLECLTGRPEYPGSDVEAAIARLTRAPRVPDRLPPALRAILVAMLAREPAARPDAARCAELFEDYLARPNRAADPPTLAETTAVVAPTPPVRRWRAVHLAAAGVLLAGIATGALLTTTSRGDQPAAPPPAPVQTPVPVVNVVPETAAGQVEGQPPATHQQQSPKPKKGKEKGGNGGAG